MGFPAHKSRKISRLLKTNPKAIDSLNLVLKKGMPPYSNQKDLDCECGCQGNCPKGYDWDYEHLPKDAYQATDRSYFR